MTDKLGNKIKTARLKRGLSREEFAAGMGVPPETTDEWESGTALPVITDYAKISELLGVPETELLLAAEEDDPDVCVPDDANFRPRDGKTEKSAYMANNKLKALAFTLIGIAILLAIALAVGLIGSH